MPESSTMNLRAKESFVKGRENKPTTLGSSEISSSPEFTAKVRAHSFFSARVAESRILDRLRHYSDEYSSGKTDRATARAQLKSYLRGQGYSPDGAVTDTKSTDRSLANLASSARLDLVLRQNKAMAQAVGKKEEITRLGAPYQRYVPSWKANPRDNHREFYNIVLPVDDPFWDTHTPPLDFNCGCSVQAVWDAKDAEQYGGVSSAKPIDSNEETWQIDTPHGKVVAERPQSGFVFDSAAPFEQFDLERIKQPAARRAVAREMVEKSEQSKFPFALVGIEKIKDALAGYGDRVSIANGVAYALGEEGEKIGKVFDRAVEKSGVYMAEDLRPVEGRTRQMIEAVRPDWNLEGCMHAVNSNDFSHSLSKHAEGNEKAPGLIGLTREDFKRIPVVITSPDKVEPGNKPTSVKLSKSFPDGTIIYIENHQTGKKRLMGKTIWKEKGGSVQ